MVRWRSVRTASCPLCVLAVTAVIHIMIGVLSCGRMSYSLYSLIPYCQRAFEERQRLRYGTCATEAWEYFTDTSEAAAARRSADRRELEGRLRGEVDICTVVITVPRPRLSVEVQYVLTTVRRALDVTLASKGTALVVVDATQRNGKHTSADVIGQTVPVKKAEVVRRQSMHNWRTEHQQQAAQRSGKSGALTRDDWKLSETLDYSTALSECLQYWPRYVLVLEDDVLLSRDAITAIRYQLEREPLSALTTMEQRHLKWSRASRPRGAEGNATFTPLQDQWAYVKLYYPEKWSGFEQHHALPLAGMVALLSIGITLLCTEEGLRWSKFVIATSLPATPARALQQAGKEGYSSPHRNKGRSAQPRFPPSSYPYAVAILTALTMALLSLILAVGKYNLESLRTLSLWHHKVIPADPCCSPAILFPSQSARQLRNHTMVALLDGASTKGWDSHLETDLFMDDFFRTHAPSLPRYLTVPYLVEHLGAVSSLAWKNTTDI